MPSAFDEALKAPLLTLTEREPHRHHRRQGSDSSTTSTLSTASSSLPSRNASLNNNRSSSSSSSKSKRIKYPTKGRGSRKPIQGPPKECFDPALSVALGLENNNNNTSYYAYDERYLLSPEELQKLESGALNFDVAIAQERHGEISSLTLDMQQIRCIQTDLAVFIDDQQMGIDDIEYSLTKTRSRVDKGVNQLEHASSLQQRRQKFDKALMIFAAVAAIGLVMYYFFRRHT